MRVVVLLMLAGIAAAAPEAPSARIEFFLREKTGIKKQRFVDAVAKTLDKEGVDLKRLPLEYAKFNGGTFRNYQQLYFIYKGRKPMFKDVKAAMAEAPSEAAREGIRDHRSWLALEAYGTKRVAKNYRTLCRIAAELLGPDVVALRFPARKAWILGDAKDLAKKLRSEDPLKALGIGATADEQRQAEAAAVRAKATADARKRFGEFKEAFRKRGKTGATLFSVVYESLGGKEEEISVKEIKGTRIKGFLLSKNMADWNKTIEDYQILDWSYKLGGKSHGNFRLRAFRAYYKKKLGK